MTGMLVPVKNINAFTKAMNLLVLSNSYRNELAKAAYRWSTRFDWEKSALIFYRILLGSLREDLEYQAAGRIALANYKDTVNTEVSL